MIHWFILFPLKFKVCADVNEVQTASGQCICRTGYVRDPVSKRCVCPPNHVEQLQTCTACIPFAGSACVCPKTQLKCVCKPGLAPTTHLPTHPLGFLGGWAVEKTQKNPLLCKNHWFILEKNSIYFRIFKSFIKSLCFSILHQIQDSLYKK